MEEQVHTSLRELVNTLGDLFSRQRVIRGSGRIVEEHYEVSDFNGVTLMTSGKLHLKQGDKESLRIEAEDNLLPYFETDIYNRTLRVRCQEYVTLRPTRPVNFYLTAKSPVEIKLYNNQET